MYRPNVPATLYPVTPVMSAFGAQEIASVVAVPVAVSVCADVHVFALIALVAKAFAPLATVRVIVADTLGNVIVVESVPAIVMEFEAVRVFPLAIVKVLPVAGAVIVTLLTVPGVLIFPLASIVAVAAGVCRVVVPPPVTKAVLVNEPAPTTVTVPDPVPHAAAPAI